MQESMGERMDTNDEVKATDVVGCPMHAIHHERPVLAAEDELVFPHHKRVVAQYATDASGGRELHLYYGEKEISFDEPELFAFGEGLARYERFFARDASAWGSGYEWPRIRALLEQLLDEGILRRVDAHTSDAISPHHGPRPSPLPPAAGAVPRTWCECEAITRELTGHPLELGYLEALVPIYRVAHIALDAEGRQVGEANVFPKPLRLDIPTEWRTCPHPGSRFQQELPMNVTAMKSMRAYWKPMMVTLRRIREAYLRRVPQARYGWTVGSLERLSSLVLTVPAYVLMRRHDPVENGQLHPVLSSMYRVTDGVRMTMHYMLFIPTYEPTRDPTAAVTSAEIYAYAERNALFLSEYGVCAGPKAMIDEFLHILVDGQPVEGEESIVLDPAIEAALADLDAAFDYGFYGLQTHAVVSSLWTAVARTYERLLAILEAWPAEESEVLLALRERFQSLVTFIRTRTFVQTEEWRASRDRAYADMYEQAANGLDPEGSARTLSAYLTPVWEVHHGYAMEQLRVLLQQRLCPSHTRQRSALESFVACLMDYLRQEQAIVRATGDIQQRINHLLGRTPPLRPLTASDLHVYYLLQEVKRRPPYLMDELEEELGLHIIVTANTIELTDCSAS
jgi:hypothetical protein